MDPHPGVPATGSSTGLNVGNGPDYRRQSGQAFYEQPGSNEGIPMSTISPPDNLHVRTYNLEGMMSPPPHSGATSPFNDPGQAGAYPHNRMPTSMSQQAQYGHGVDPSSTAHGHGGAYNPYHHQYNASQSSIGSTQMGILLNKRRAEALKEMDSATFWPGWWLFKVSAVAGAGFFTDAYDIFAINVTTVMLGYVYRQSHSAKLSPGQDLGIKVSTQVGALIGQLVFGWYADMKGRKRMYGVEILMIITATLAQALSGASPAVNIIGILIVWRFLMGLGIGGDYPLSAIITSEFTPVDIRGRLMTVVFANQGWGQLTAAIVTIAVIASFRHTWPEGDPNIIVHVDRMWRIIIGFGCIPGILALYVRMTIPETPRYTMDIERNVSKAVADIEDFISTGVFKPNPDAPIERVKAPQASWKDFKRYFSKRENAIVLFGVCWSWFAIDFAFYGLGLNSAVILQYIGFGDQSCAGGILANADTKCLYHVFHSIAVGNIVLTVAGLIPGYWATFCFVDWWGRKPIQLMGFSVLTVLFAIIGFGYTAITGTNGNGFIVLYCIANFFQNFGPNTTTFIVPGEIFPTRYRSTCYGIAAASGKLGAIIVQIAFSLQLRTDNHSADQIARKNRILFGLLFAMMITGIGSTWLIPETKKKTLEMLSTEPQDEFITGPSLPPDHAAEHGR